MKAVLRFGRVGWLSLSVFLFFGPGCSWQFARADNLDEWRLTSLKAGASMAGSPERLVMVGGLGGISCSTNGQDWVSVDKPGNPFAGDYATGFRDVAYGNGIFVAVGSHQIPYGADVVIAASSNGLDWTEQIRIPSNGGLHSVVFGGDKFVAVGGGAGGHVLVSSNGINWHSYTPTASIYLTDVAYGGGGFVAVSVQDGALASQDGVNWTKTGPGLWAESVTFGQGRFIAMSRFRTYWSSPDGTNWVQQNLNWDDTLNGPSPIAIAYDQDTFVAVGSLGSPSGDVGSLILTSSDGQTWIRRPTLTSETILGTCFWDDTFIVFGPSSGIAQSQPFSNPKRPPYFLKHPASRIVLSGAATSFDASAVSSPTLSFQWQRNGVLLTGKTNSSLTVTPGLPDAGDYSVVASASFGTATSSVASLTVVEPIAVFPPAGLPVTVGGDVTLGVAASSNSPASFRWRRNQQALANATNSTLSLTNIQLSQSAPYDVIVTNATGAVTNPPLFVIVEPYADHPLFHWINRSPPDLPSALTGYGMNGIAGSLSGIEYGNGCFVTVGSISGSDFGVILSSSDGVNWTRRMVAPIGQQSPVFNLYDLAFGNGTFVAVGYVSSIYSSTNGIDWALRKSGPYATYYDRVVFTNGAFWVGQTGGQTVWSNDGVTWQNWPSWPGYSDPPTFGGSIYARTSGSAILISTNAQNWTTAYSSDSYLTDIAFGGGAFVAVGQGGVIIESQALARIAMLPTFPPQLEVSGLLGRSYRIDHRDTLEPSNGWNVFATFVLTNNPVIWPINSGVSSDQRFYRAALLP